jgi:predicted phosphodiesterase
MNELEKTKQLREFIKLYPNYPNKKLARMFYAENPLLYTNEENVRSNIRKLLGQTGNNLQKDKSLFMDAKPLNPYNLPESFECDYSPFELKCHNLLVLSDIHIPYHSISALSTCFDYVSGRKVDAILLNGDTIDCHMLSRFVRDPKARNFGEELDAFAEFFVILKKIWDVPIYFKLGNHEERYNHFLWMKANELTGVEEFNLEAIIKKRANVEVISDKRIIKAGNLNILHGHEFQGGVFSPVNIARGLFLKAKVNAMQGHNHQTSEHSERDLEGKITTTWSVGCLSELHPAYMPINKWNHGFSMVQIEDNGSFEVQNKRIHQGKLL